MRYLLSILVIALLGFGNNTFAQKKVNKMNGLSETKATKKKYNKQWIKMRSAGLPSFSVGVGFAGGPSNISHGVSDIQEFGRTMLLSPELNFYINPTKNLGFNFGLSYRNMRYTYFTENATFTNDTITAIVDGDWQQKFGNIGISLGFSYYGNIAKSILSCNGFGIVNTSTTYFYFENGVTFAPALFNEVYFNGRYNEFINGEPGNSADLNDWTIMYNSQPRNDAMLFYYAKLGLRFSSTDGFATRIGPFFNLQLNSNRGLVNDYTDQTTSVMAYGVNLVFEFY
jgi:hypothetical protein